MKTVVITEDTKYDSNAPSSSAETMDRALIVSTQTGKVKLEFTSLEALRNALFEIMLLHAWAEWYHQEGISYQNIPDRGHLQQDRAHR